MLEVVMFWVGAGLVVVGLVWKAALARRRRRAEAQRPGYIHITRVDPNRNGHPTYYTYEMRRAGRHRRA